MTDKNYTQKLIKLCFDKLYSRLNPMQRKAVQTVNGPLLVLAGAGSGKTTVLVHRIYQILSFGSLSEENIPEKAYNCTSVLEKAVNGTNADAVKALKSLAVSPASPDSVLCITFTNKAAGEFKSRLSDMLGDTASMIWAGTFHSICVRILRANIHRIGFSNSFTIYDTDDTKKLITQVVKDLNIDEKLLPPKLVLSAISGYKEKRIMPEEALLDASDFREKKIAECYGEYQNRLKAASALDFDDLILNTIILFEECPDVLAFYAEKFRYILVDEYQDTNPSQNDLVIMLGSRHRNVCVVGDDDQSIYSFRGATVENILSFDNSFKEAETIKLEQNYRSTKNILDAANSVIACNSGRKGKNLWTSGDTGDRISVRCLYTQTEESDYICTEIAKLHACGTPLKDIAVLYRVNAISNSVETALVKNRIPYKVYGGIRFYERKEIKDIIAYLSLVCNHSDNVRLRRIINFPRRSIGDTTVDTIASIAANEGISMFEVIKKSASYDVLHRSYQKLENFYALICDLTDYSTEHTVSELINEVITRTGYDIALDEAGEHDKTEIIREFASTGLLYEQSAENPTLHGFLEDIALVSDLDNYDESEESVSLMTIHSAKGLEFTDVFLPGFEEGIFPSSLSVQEGNIEEERRLAYVAITRAKKKLYITYTRSRTIYGFTQPSLPSQFLEEIPDDYKELTRSERQFTSYRSMYADTDDERPIKNHNFESGKRRNAKDFVPEKKEETKKEFISAGDRISHKFFGEGTVVSVEQIGSDALIEVNFDNGQNKKLMQSFAKLEKK